MKRQTTHSEEWDFSEIPNNELIDAWNWESAREIERQHPGILWNELSGSLRGWFETRGIWGLPYARLRAEHKNFLFRHEKKRSIREIPGSHVDAYAAIREVLQEDVHCFLISRYASRTSLLKDFDVWLSEKRKTMAEAVVRPKRPGRPIDGNAWLCDLAIFRAAEAGYTRKQAAVLLSWVKLKGRSTAFSESHFEDAQRNTRHRLEQKVAQIEIHRVVNEKRRQLGHLLIDAGFNAFGR